METRWEIIHAGYINEDGEVEREDEVEYTCSDKIAALAYLCNCYDWNNYYIQQSEWDGLYWVSVEGSELRDMPTSLRLGFHEFAGHFDALMTRNPTGQGVQAKHFTMNNGHAPYWYIRPTRNGNYRVHPQGVDGIPGAPRSINPNTTTVVIHYA